MMNLLRQLFAATALSILISFSPMLCAQEAVGSFAVPSATATASANAENPFVTFTSPSRKPIPVRWKIAIVLVVFLLAAGALWISIRVWGSANLFDRQYYFPASETAAVRLGANRSGGHLAAIKFDHRAGPSDGI
jgi:hypothetical protein